jgi:hypothetical protein
MNYVLRDGPWDGETIAPTPPAGVASIWENFEQSGPVLLALIGPGGVYEAQPGEPGVLTWREWTDEEREAQTIADAIEHTPEPQTYGPFCLN